MFADRLVSNHYYALCSFFHPVDEVICWRFLVSLHLTWFKVGIILLIALLFRWYSNELFDRISANDSGRPSRDDVMMSSAMVPSGAGEKNACRRLSPTSFPRFSKFFQRT
jgi:hypothetical protein